MLASVAACAALGWVDDAPLSPGPGGELVGSVPWAWVFLAALVAAFVAYLAALRMLARRASRLRAVVALAAAIQLAPLAAPLLLSSDAWTYWAYGRISIEHGQNPYRETPAAFDADPAMRWAGAAWRDSTSVYGPGFTLASEPVAAAAGTSPERAAWIFKALAGLAAVAATLLAARFGTFSAAFVGWNPLLAVHLAGGGHNDAWVGALVLAAVAADAAGRRHLAGVSWVASIAVKWVPLVLFPLRALAARAGGRRPDHLALVLATLLVLALATWRYGLAWAGAFGPLAENARETTRFALPQRLSRLGVPIEVAIALFAGIFAGVYAVLARDAWHGRARLALAAGVLVACSPYVAPWYLAWVVPLAAVEDDRVARGLALALCAYLLPQAVPV